MEAKDFSESAHEMVKFIVDYLENIRERKVLPDVQPGYLRQLIPDLAPENPENWSDVMADIERVIMPGISHWQSPRFHAYFPVIQSYPSVLADILSGGLNCTGISWIASPACTELEIVTMDWLGKMLDLPAEFLACSGGRGGGVIQGTASEATLVALLGAKQKMIKWYKENRPSMSEDDVAPKLVAYCSDQAHCGVERTARISGVKMHVIVSDEKRRMSTKDLEDAIKADREAGKIPFYVVATLGTTNSCVFDDLNKIGDITQKENLWLHVDAAYAGTAFVCPEFRYLMKGIDKADSFNFNPHKWMMVNFDCSAMWVRDREHVTDALGLDPPYMKTQTTSSTTEYRNWQIPFGRRFRSLKLWFTLRLVGVENIRSLVRKHVKLAHRFEELCKNDGRFEIVEEVVMGLVCFKLKGGNDVNRALHAKIHSRGNIFLVPSLFVNADVFFLRFVVASRFIEAADIDFSFKEVCDCADEVLRELKNH